jgi:hypothetical protein
MGRRKPPSASFRRSRALIVFGLIAFVLPNPGAQAVAAPGQIDHADLSTSVRYQGLGGPVVVTATLYAGSDPHRTLFVTDLNVNLDFGSGFALLAGENPIVVPSLPIQPSAGLFAKSFSWTLNATSSGDWPFHLNVSSASSGSAKAEAVVQVRAGVVLGKTTLQPGAPTTGDPVRFSVTASSGFDDSNLTLNVSLCFYETGATVKPLSATGRVLRLWTPDNVPWTVAGSCLPMSGGNGSFVYVAPPRPRESMVYWIFAETAINNVTSAPVRVFVEDPGTTAAVLWGALGSVATITAGALYAVMYDPFGRKPAKGSLHNSPDRTRVSFALLTVGIAILTAAVVSGAAVGLWRWFGYL